MKDSRVLETNQIFPTNTTAVMSGVAWLVSTVLTLTSVFALREILIWAIGLAVYDPNAISDQQAKALINLSNQCGTIVIGMIALGVILFTGELVFTKASQPRTLRTLLRLIAVEAVLVVPIALIFWL